MKLLISLLALLLLAGCMNPVREQAAPAAAAAESAPTPEARVIPTDDGAFVCLAPDAGKSEQWPAACAELGPWRRCLESATQLQCMPDPRRPA